MYNFYPLWNHTAYLLFQSELSKYKKKIGRSLMRASALPLAYVTVTWGRRIDKHLAILTPRYVNDLPGSDRRRYTHSANSDAMRCICKEEVSFSQKTKLFQGHSYNLLLYEQCPAHQRKLFRYEGYTRNYFSFRFQKCQWHICMYVYIFKTSLPSDRSTLVHWSWRSVTFRVVMKITWSCNFVVKICICPKLGVSCCYLNENILIYLYVLYIMLCVWCSNFVLIFLDMTVT